MPTYSMKFKIQKQLEHMHDLVSFDDETCIDNLRMSRNAFGHLCYILANGGGLENTKNVTVSEQVAIFLIVLAHHKKNCIVKHDFKRSGYTISKHFNSVLSALLKLHNLFLVKPTPIEDDTTNERWKWFKGCLGALDDTYIPFYHTTAYSKIHVLGLQWLRHQAGSEDLLARGYKADNGFKSGYQMLLEQAMSRSGFGWNDATNMITVESEDAWNNFVKTDSNARNMRYKTWPLYKDWVEIFGKDSATGEGAEAILKSMNANYGGSNKSLDKRKRKVVDENDDRFIDPMTSFCDKTNERLGDISRRIGFEHDASLSRKAVYEALGDLGSSLDMEGKILVSHLIVNNTKNMDLFFSLPNDGRKTMVHMILEGKFSGMGGY
ncbi:hypothetical protein BUALT_Bualt19G0060500 [Buddleja alternifolia]|uniref:DUF8040 domain-containing protein n=1 Tax=Buddleja alternifolia TaxID=168488 RepID=A0AAV6WA09_9LAMI|nr:hypothetical protein BUALT_Bualt19G0060500 [Buddleja alternifolia]